MLNNNNVAKAFAATQNLVQFSLDNIEKSTQLQLEVSKDLLNDTFTTIKGMTQVSNVKDLFAYANKVATATVEKNVNNFNTACNLVNKGQAEFSKLVESQISSVNANAALTEFLNKFKSANLNNVNLDTFTKAFSSAFNVKAPVVKAAAATKSTKKPVKKTVTK